MSARGPVSDVLAVLRRHARSFGVSRYGSTTALDRTGVPTSTAVRSDFVVPGVSVASGKGRTADEAETSALGEALERFCAEPRDRVPTVRAARAGLDAGSPALPSLTLAFWSRVTDDTTLSWCSGRRLADDARTWVPANATFFPYEPPPEEHLFRALTTGLAAGLSLRAAALTGLLECIEVDQYSRAVALVAAAKPDVSRAPHHRCLSDWASEVRARLERAGFHIVLHDITADLHVPTVVATVCADGQAHMGSASRPRMQDAIDAALAEACQSRVTDLQGAREDLDEPSPSSRVHPWFTTPPPANACEAASSDPSLEAILQRVRDAGAGEPLMVDLSLAGVPLFVVRVVAPGLEIWGADPDRMGPRARAWFA